jgi:DNA-binding response OmpR family regulator
MLDQRAEVRELLDRMTKLAAVCLQPEAHRISAQIETLTSAYMEPTIPEHEWIYDLPLNVQGRNILMCLSAKFGRIVNRESIYNALYFKRGGSGPDMKILDVLICKARNVLKEQDSPYWIETVWGVGYKLVKDKGRPGLRTGEGARSYG